MSQYVHHQLLRAMRTVADHPDPDVREAASERVERWQQVIDGVADGTLRIGSRRPLVGLPAWVTLRVVRGGFATGKAAAAIPPAVDERLRAQRLGIEATRQAIFESWLTPEGLAELEVLLETGAYNVGFPEHAVLLSVAALLRHGADDSVRALLDEVAPLAGSLRFSPYPGAPSPLRPGQVSRWTARQVAGALEKTRINPRVAAEREALTVWLPLTDKVVAFWAGIIEAPAFDESRIDEARALVADYDRASQQHTRCRKYRRPGENLPILIDALRQVIDGQGTWPPGRVKHVLSRIEAKRGLPGSKRSDDLRARQAVAASRPLHAEVAVVVADRVAQLRGDVGLTDFPAASAPVSDEEATDVVPAGTPLPVSVLRTLRLGLVSDLEELITLGVVPSAEVLASLVPQLTAGQVASSADDPLVGALLAAIYRAFRQRRSLLLLDLERQVRFKELPWVAALQGLTTDGPLDDPLVLARRLGSVVLDAFPGTILPNGFVREYGTLLDMAQVRLPLTEELATDIFMGRFSPKFQQAAKVAAELLHGSLYERYYGIDYAAVLGLPEPDGHGNVEEFDRMVAGDVPAGRSVAANGQIIERQQILTTHNLAVLVKLGVQPGRSWTELAHHAARRSFQLLERARNSPWLLSAIKNAAYAWRQAVFFLSICGDDTATDALRDLPGATTWPTTQILDDLTRCHQGEPVTPFTGWTQGPHWAQSTVLGNRKPPLWWTPPSATL